MSSDHRFWSNDGDGFQTHATAEEAQEVCRHALRNMRDESADCGWPSEVEHIMWGTIAERVVETARHEGHRPTCADFDCEADCPVLAGFLYWSDYQLVEVKP